MTRVPRKARFYIDGLNLYHGMRAANVPGHLLWLDMRLLAAEMLDPGETVDGVRYFNAPAWLPEKWERQRLYLAALSAHTGLEPHLGQFKEKYRWCSQCGQRNTTHEEKRTDVAIGAHLIRDLHQHSFDIAVIVSGDSDLAAAIEVARTVRPVHIRVAFPPRRGSEDLKAVCDDHRRIKEKHLHKCELPNPVDVDGSPVYRPEKWQ